MSHSGVPSHSAGRDASEGKWQERHGLLLNRRRTAARCAGVTGRNFQLQGVLEPVRWGGASVSWRREEGLLALWLLLTFKPANVPGFSGRLFYHLSLAPLIRIRWRLSEQIFWLLTDVCDFHVCLGRRGLQRFPYLPFIMWGLAVLWTSQLKLITAVPLLMLHISPFADCWTVFMVSVLSKGASPR